MTICDSTSAQIAFVYNESAGRATEVVGAQSVSPHWGRELTHALAERFPRGGIWNADAMESGSAYRRGRSHFRRQFSPLSRRDRRGWSPCPATPSNPSTTQIFGSSRSSGGFRSATTDIFASTTISRTRSLASSAVCRRRSTPRTRTPAATANASPGSPSGSAKRWAFPAVRSTTFTWPVCCTTSARSASATTCS